jgi:hypothetical protein
VSGFPFPGTDDTVRTLFVRLRGQAYKLFVDYMDPILLELIVANLSQRNHMPLSYFMPPFHRVCTGETLITRKHQLLGLSGKMAFQVKRKKESDLELKKWLFLLFSCICVLIYRFRIVVFDIVTAVCALLYRIRPVWLFMAYLTVILFK